MAKLWTSLLGKRGVERRFDDGSLTFGGLRYPLVGVSPRFDREQIENNFVGYVQGAYKSDGVVFACMLARLLIFGEARFQWQRMVEGTPGEMTWSRELRLFERPWPNGSTGELLARMIQDADLSGNFYAVREGTRLRRLRPDWVEIILTAAPSQAVESDVAGYLYRPGGLGSTAEPELYLPDEIVHWSPIPDPEAQYRGMSWLTPVVREILGDRYATEHKLAFYTNGATLQTVISLKETVSEDKFRKFAAVLNDSHQGVQNAYRPLVVGGGADVTLVGADMKQLDFRATQGAGETRIAAASGVHPVIVGLSEGLAGSALNAGNFNSARRLTADKTMRPLWRSACAALESVVRVPSSTRLWFDDRDVAFLREDRQDLAKIQATEAQTLRTLIDGGYEPESVTAAVKAYDWSLLEHSGNLSVQLQPAEPDDQAEDEDDDQDDDGEGPDPSPNGDDEGDQ